MSTQIDIEEARSFTPHQAREVLRSGVNQTTSGWSDGWVQCNVLAVDQDVARDLMVFAQRNPRSCPIVDILEPGQYSSPKFQGDIRTDLPGYTVYQDGNLFSSTNDARNIWREEFYTFFIGCSFTFENAFRRLHIPLRHHEDERTVPMYRTSIECDFAGSLSGPTVVTLRYMPASLVADAVRISARYPSSHGAPIHVGDPTEIGIKDLGSPDWGDPPLSWPGDVPMFWACGVTPQAVAMNSKLNFAIAHEPGRMAIMDIDEESMLVP